MAKNSHSPNPPSPPHPAESAPAAPAPDPDAGRPLLNSFAVLKKDKIWHGFLIETRGTKVLREKVIESDDSRAVVLDAVDRAAREWWIYGVDPWSERNGRGP